MDENYAGNVGAYSSGQRGSSAHAQHYPVEENYSPQQAGPHRTQQSYYHSNGIANDNSHGIDQRGHATDYIDDVEDNKGKFPRCWFDDLCMNSAYCLYNVFEIHATKSY